MRGSRNYLESSQKPGCLGSSDHTGQLSPGKQAGSGVPLVTTEIRIILQYLYEIGLFQTSSSIIMLASLTGISLLRKTKESSMVPPPEL